MIGFPSAQLSGWPGLAGLSRKGKSLLTTNSHLALSPSSHSARLSGTQTLRLSQKLGGCSWTRTNDLFRMKELH